MPTFEIINPVVKKTTRRTITLTLENILKISKGQMTLREGLQRTQQSIIAVSKGELTVRQATERYLRTAKATRGLDRKTLTYLVKEFHLYEQEHTLFEAILFGGYEVRHEADADLRAIASSTDLAVPAWHVEILKDLFSGFLSKENWKLINRVIAIGQGGSVFGDWVAGIEDIAKKKGLLQQLGELDNFIGLEKYSERVRFLIDIAEGRIAPPKIASLKRPPAIEVSDISGEDIPIIKEAALLALSRLNEIIFAAVVGGTAERMQYLDTQGKPLPQATFPFLPLSRGDIFKLHADEIIALKNLYFLTRESSEQPLNIPYFMMTSDITDRKIMEDFETHSYFGLGKRNVNRVVQALVPVVSEDGRWLRVDRYRLNTKPHGHGDFWQLYFNSAAQAELAENMKNFTLVLQGNNPFVLAHALEFAGLGIKRDAAFGLATCPREAKAPEGSVVLAQDEKRRLSIRNIEYAVMTAFGIKDEALPETGYSAYPGNLNLLFGDTRKIRPIVAQNPFPGEIINLQKPQDSFGDGKKVLGGRGESQVQGVAEEITASTLKRLPTFVMNAQRGSHPSSHFDVFKNKPGSPRDTVASCRQNYSDRAAARLLIAGVNVEYTMKKDAGGKDLPTTSSVIELTPAFANRQDILNAKIRGGKIAQGSTVYLSGFHTNIIDLDVTGDFEIKVENEIGDTQLAKDNLGQVIPDPARAGKVRINGLTVKNAGRKKVLEESQIWQGNFEDKEHCRIVIKGNGELVVEPGTVIEGDFDLVIEDHGRVILSSKPGRGYQITQEKITEPSWRYRVTLNHSKDTLDLFELKSEPEILLPASVADYSLQHPDQVIDISHLMNVPALLSQLNASHQNELRILNKVFKVEGSLVYDVEFRPHPEHQGVLHPFLFVHKGSKSVKAASYPSRVDMEWKPARDQKASTIQSYLSKDPLKIYVDPVEESKGPDFQGYHYIAVPNILPTGRAEIILLIGKFNEGYNGGKKQELLQHKLDSLLKMAVVGRTISEELKDKVTKAFSTIPWQDLFELATPQLFETYLKPKLGHEGAGWDRIEKN